MTLWWERLWWWILVRLPWVSHYCRCGACGKRECGCLEACDERLFCKYRKQHREWLEDA